MLFIIFTIFCITTIGIIFKLFPYFDINAFQAIVVNYLVCVLAAWVHLGFFPITSGVILQNWFPFSVGLSICFITGFYFQSIIFKAFGIAISTIILKLSLVITVIFSIMMYHEEIFPTKVLGFLFAIAAIIMVSYPSKGGLEKSNSHSRMEWTILFASFFISALVDIGFQYCERSVISKSADPQFIACATGFAFIWGLAIEYYRWATKTSSIQLKNIKAGIVLGLVNYATFIGLMKSLGSNIDGSTVFTSLNIGAILVSTFVGLILFKEQLAKINFVGIILALAAVILISKVQ